MNIHITEQKRQNAVAAAIKDRLFNSAVEVHQSHDLQMKKDLRQAKTIIADQDKLIAKLELDLADAQARILSQAKRITELTIEEEEVTNFRRPVRAIVAEVLRDFPGVTWEDIISVRRTRDLTKPRQICMSAVYEERKDLSLPAVGRLFRRDHTTILHAVHKLRAQEEAA